MDKKKAIQFLISLKSNKYFIIIGLIILLLGLILLVTKLYLVLNLMLGNDLTVTLNIDKENLFLKHGESEKVQFKVYAITNPFCTTVCNSELYDLSDGKIIDQENFSLTSSIPLSKEYEISAQKQGTGQKIYQFRIKCQSKSTSFCKTKEKPKYKSSMITLNYDLNDNEKSDRENSREKISLMAIESNNMIKQLSDYALGINEFDYISELKLAIQLINTTSLEVYSINDSAYLLKEKWENSELDNIASETASTEEGFMKTKKDFIELNTTINLEINQYNSLIDSINSQYIKLNNLNEIVLANTTVPELNRVIREFNLMVSGLYKNESITAKENRTAQTGKEIDKIENIIYKDLVSNKDLLYNSNESISPFTFKKIIINLTHEEFSFSLAEPKQICCRLGNCTECCNSSCKEDSSKYPVIFLHGHNFNKKISAENSLDAFSEIQNQIEDEGYINAGSIIIGEYNETIKGIWGRPVFPLTVKASYYFDIFNNKGQKMIIQTKEDNLDTYTIRLKDIINEVEYKTGRDKVIIVAHSMGGLVTRRYLDIFGSQEISRVILVTVPNKGLSGSIKSYCSLFGTKLECTDMNEDSLFMSKLSSSKDYTIPVYNIIGIGCAMDEETGDGIVKNSSAYLPNAENYYIKGTCDDSSFRFLHNEITEPSKYPDAYQLIAELLKKN